MPTVTAKPTKTTKATQRPTLFCPALRELEDGSGRGLERIKVGDYMPPASLKEFLGCAFVVAGKTAGNAFLNLLTSAQFN
jgi:hypothetical protein